MIRWCTFYKFELIELLPSDSIEVMDFDEDHNKYGIDRIIEALEAHVWPNIIMKGLLNL